MSTNSIFHYEFTVVETHLDFMGHMNNATYLQVFEEARWEIVVHRGYDYKMRSEEHTLNSSHLKLSRMPSSA